MKKKMSAIFSLVLSVSLLLPSLIFPVVKADETELFDPMMKIIDSCDSVGDWGSGNGTIAVDSIDFQSGSGAIKLTQPQTRNTADIYSKMSKAVNLTGMDYLEFDLYTDDIDIFYSDASVEISSSGEADKNELFWTIADLKEQIVKTGWNHIKLDLSKANVNGGAIDIAKVNWFRIYFLHNKNKSVTLKIDNLYAAKAYASNYTEAGDLGFTLSGTTNNMFSAVKTNISMNLNKTRESYALYLRVYLYAQDTPGDLTNFTSSSADGQIELTSSGTNDKQEINYLTRNIAWKHGWNDIVIPLSSMGNTNGEGANSGSFDITKLNYMRLYHKVLNDKTFKMTVTQAKILDITEGLSMPTHYGDNMLFQQKKPINLKGKASSGKRIDAVIYNSESGVEAVSGFTNALSDGSWEIELPALTGGYTDYHLDIYENGALSKRFNDVVVGELWLTAGQSNMEFRLDLTKDGSDLLKGTLDDNYMRYLTMPTIPYGGNNSGDQPFDPQENIKGAYWGRGDQKQFLSGITAVGYHFAEKLREELDMPVGIINAALGATSSYAWMSLESINANAEMKSYLQSIGRYPTESNWNKQGTNNFAQTMSTYNSKVAPLTNLNIAGMLWYQGESNSQEAAGRYKKSLDLLYQDYSDKFGFDGDMPFVFSHLATYNYSGYASEQTSYLAEDMSAFWRENRENTAQVSIYDIALDYDFSGFASHGVSDPIHPYTKKPVAERMAMSALGLVYNKQTENTSPVYKTAKAVDGTLEITFDHVADGLSVKGEDGMPLKGFTIAGADGIYVPAKAEIMSKDKVKVWNDTVKHPVAVTYAFTQMNMNANLVSLQDGKTAYAAVPFRSEKITNAQYSHVDDFVSMDYEKIWHDLGNKIAKASQTWKNGMIINSPATISYDKLVKKDGLSSLKLDYTSDEYKSFGITPNFYIDMNKNFSHYQTLSFDLLNSDAGEVNIKEFIILKNGKYYTPYILGQSNCLKKIQSGAEWTNVTLDLTKFYQLGGNETLNAAEMGSWEAVQIAFFDERESGATGTIHIDNLVFGFKPDKAEIDKTTLLNKINEARNMDLSVVSPSVAMAIKTALTSAENTLQNNSALQNQVNTAVENLIAAVDSEDSEDYQKAKAVSDMIVALPSADDVTLADKAAIANARAAFNALLTAQQELVDSTVISKLIDLEAKIKQLEQNATDADKAKAVEDKITALPEVAAIKISDKATVAAARAAFTALTAEQKAMISAWLTDKLKALEDKIVELETENTTPTDSTANTTTTTNTTASSTTSSTTSSETTGTKAGQSQTGDSSKAGLFIALIVTAITAMIVVIRRKKVLD